MVGERAGLAAVVVFAIGSTRRGPDPVSLVLAGAATLDALALGDDLARGLGVGPAAGRAVVLAGVVILSGVATALAGRRDGTPR